MDGNVLGAVGGMPGGSGLDERPAAAFSGNTYDMAALAALVSGLLMVFMCGTCNMGLYCLPFAPLILGVIGLLTADRAVDQRRARTWAWIGVGIGAAAMVLIALAVVAYAALIAVAVSLEGR